MAQRRQRNTRAKWPKIAMLVALNQFGTPAEAQESAGTVSPDLAAQKVQMLETLFASERLKAARTSNPQAVDPLVADAQSNLDAARTALDQGHAHQAIRLLDEGMRLISRAVASGGTQRIWDQQDASIAFVARRRQAESYLAVLEADSSVSAQEQQRVAQIRSRLTTADKLFTGGDVTAANEALEDAYRQTVHLVSEIRQGLTMMVEHKFDTPADEFAYEDERNENYELLVEIAVAERGENEPTFAALAARVMSESRQFRDLAEGQAQRGEYAEAIDSMEQATERLLVVLRAAGLILTE